jgi:dolichol kinase
MTEAPEEAATKRLGQDATIEYRHELIRKAIHLCSLSIPVIYYFIPKSFALKLLAPITFSFLAVDLARLYIPSFAQLFYGVFGWLLRKKERTPSIKSLNGATNVLLSACLCVLIFPKVITVTAFAILIISDSTSALIGRRFGKRKFFDKSLEGSLAFVASALLVVIVTPKVAADWREYAIGFFAAAVGAVVEASSSAIDDNISVPVSIGAVMWALYALLLPALDLYLTK